MSKSNIEVTFTGWVATAPHFTVLTPLNPEKSAKHFPGDAYPLLPR